MQRIVNGVRFIAKKGLNGFLTECYDRLSDHRWEKHFGVETAGLVSRQELGIDSEESLEYSSVAYRHIFRVLNRLPIDVESSTLLDYGCGKGRVMVVAASLPFRRIIGVELSALVTKARENTSRMAHRKAEEIEFFEGDARDYPVPADVNVIYFYNPFRGSILAKVLANIRESHEGHLRKIRIVCFNDDDFSSQPWTHSWLIKTAEYEVSDDLTLGLYETVD